MKYLNLVLIAVVVLLLAQGRARPAWSGPSELKIGFVNINEVFERYKKVAESRQQLDLEFERKKRVFRQRDRDLRKRMSELELVNPRSTKFRRMSDDLRNQLFQLSFDIKWAEKRRVYERRNIARKIYVEIEKTIEDYGKREGYFMILKLDPQMTEKTTAPVIYRGVLYHQKGHDLTKKIVDSLNRAK